MTPEELSKLYDKVDAQTKQSGVKGEKATEIRSIVSGIAAAKMAAGITRLSAATIKGAVIAAMTTLDAEGKEVKPKVDASQFTSIITAMYETEKDAATHALVVLVDKPKAPKARVPRKKKTEAQPAA